MIAKVVRGFKPAGLLKYLFGPGKFEEHQNQRVVASWDGAPWLHQPPQQDGQFDLRQLIHTIRQPSMDAGLPQSDPPAITPEWAEHIRSGAPLPPGAPSWLQHYAYDKRTDSVQLRQGWVWHCPVRLHPSDPTLSDAQWEHIAERLMRASGIHQAGCRWIAVRHADDHIHLVATLVSENTGKRHHPHGDWVKLRKECETLEQEFGLYSTAKMDRTAKRTPTRQEIGKAERSERAETAREELARVVAQAAASASEGTEFLRLLKGEGLAPLTVSDRSGTVVGYTVSLPGDFTAAGRPVRFSGGSLARDLTWPKLAQRWSTVDEPADTAADSGDDVAARQRRRDVLREAQVVVQRAAEAVRGGAESQDGVVHAAAEVLWSVSRAREGRDAGPLAASAAGYDRAARTPHRVVPAGLGPVARELRVASRRIAVLGALSGRGKEKAALVSLVLALAGLVAEIAAWQQQKGRVHQARASRSVAQALPRYASRPEGAARPSAHPPRAGGGRRRAGVSAPALVVDQGRPRRPG
ncbi:hypothetical protein GCM10022247_34820 [Allokutzneria multivorans]|uniref:MobA/VirD2-like nuclease domain-containing protein n=1 Tax=Allokutzneria multivorans TaxID=1142134 RepID=A0ABP7SBV9_9PSEU